MGCGTVIIRYVLILAIFAYFGRFPACFGPFRKPQSLSTLEILESSTGPAIESPLNLHCESLGSSFRGVKQPLQNVR